VADIDRETWNNRTVYEVEFAQAGRNAQVHIAEDGTIVKGEARPSPGVGTALLRGLFLGTQLEDTPAAVQEAIKREAAGNPIADIDKELRTGQPVYEVEIKQPDGNYELHIAENGTILRDSRRADAVGAARTQPAPGTTVEPTYTRRSVPLLPRTATLQLNDVPQAVQKTVQQHAAGREVADIDKETWNNRTVYEVEFAQSGRNAQMHIAEDGTVVKDEARVGAGAPTRLFGAYLGTQLEDTPAAVQETIKREARGNQIADIDKELRTGQPVYEVEIKKPEGNYELHIAENGSILRDSRRTDAVGAPRTQPQTGTGVRSDRDARPERR